MSNEDGRTRLEGGMKKKKRDREQEIKIPYATRMNTRMKREEFRDVNKG